MYQTSTSKGQELVAQRMTREFNKLGHKAYLITSLFHDDREIVPAESLKKGPGYLYTGDSVLKIPLIRVDSYIAKWPPRRIVFRDFIHTLEGIVDKFELNALITHSTLWNGPEEAAKFVTWRRDMRNLGGYQDPIVLCHMSHLQEASPLRYSLPELTFRTAWNKFSLTRIMDTANLILVVTPFEKESKVKMGASPEKCFLFPGGVDDEVFLHFAGEDTTDFLKRHNISPVTKIVSYLGTIEERKNPMAVLKVAEKLKERQDIHFVLAGRGGSDYAREVEEMARSLPNVTYLGEIEEKEKVQLMKASYLNILMSRLEALGIAQLEFMFQGVPVITSATGGQSWVIQDRVEGYHVKGPDDIDGACNAIVKLLGDDKTYRQMSSSAKQKAGKLSISSLTRELDAAIEVEMMKEGGLARLPAEVQATLVTPEHALKTWTAGTSGVVATNQRVFIRQGVVSRTVTELRYADIKSIEHARRYPWRTLLSGAVISTLFLVAPALRPLFSSVFVAQIDSWINSLAQATPAWLTSDTIAQFLLPLLPLLIAIVMFLLGARSGFKLHGIGIKPLYLPRRFKEAIGFIREKIDSLVPEVRSKSE
ncbi:MAG: glycosyltransferase family 4 protein [Chloroflexi bacterium]|nr:glycosyltransferase family 4 protein [Chloroflexota bacterium]